MKSRIQSLLIPLLLIPLFAGCATVRQRLGTTLITPPEPGACCPLPP